MERNQTLQYLYRGLAVERSHEPREVMKVLNKHFVRAQQLNQKVLTILGDQELALGIAYLLSFVRGSEDERRSKLTIFRAG